MIKLGPLRIIIPNNGQLQVRVEPYDHELAWSILFRYGDNRAGYILKAGTDDRQLRIGKWNAFCDLRNRFDPSDYGLE